MRERCAQCLTPILGFAHETPERERMCGPCFSAIWGPGGRREAVLAGQEQERESVRPARWWRRG